MEHLLSQLEELIESHISELITKTRTKQERSVQDAKVERMEVIMNQLSENDKEWLDCELVDIGCSKEEAFLYQNGFLDGVRIVNLLGKM